MLKKSKKISTAKILLKIEPPKKRLSNYLRIFWVLIFLIFSAIMFVAIPELNIFNITVYLFICVILAFVFIILKPRALLFTEKGITDCLFISALWNELEFYNFISLPDIGHNKGRRTLRLISNKAPFYDLRFMGLTRNFYDRGLFFSDAEITTAEEIFKAKCVLKEK